MRNDPVRSSQFSLLGALLLFATEPLWAAGYSVEEVARESRPAIDTVIFSGNAVLNAQGDIIGQTRRYSDDRVFTRGWRAFLWRHGDVQAVGPFGTDANGYGMSIANGINTDGQVVGVSTVFRDGLDLGPRAFVWTDGGFDRVGRESGFVATQANAISADGRIVGVGRLYERGQDKGNRSVIWIDGRVRDLGVLSTADDGHGNSAPVGINVQGQVAGNSEIYTKGEWSGVHGFIWRDDVLHDMGALGVTSYGYSFSNTVAINDRGQVAGYADYIRNGDWFGTHTVMWTDGVLRDLGSLGVDPAGIGYSVPTAINPSGHVVGYSETYDAKGNYHGSHAFLWARGAMADLGVLAADGDGVGTSFPNAINAAGDVVGFSTVADQTGNLIFHAFVHRGGALTDLNTLIPAGSGWEFENGMAINDQGQILAYGTRTRDGGSYKGFALLTPRAD
ncbi:MAG: hypothetical protein U1E83_00235 [Methylotetracoccus sp.]